MEDDIQIRSPKCYGMERVVVITITTSLWYILNVKFDCQLQS